LIVAVDNTFLCLLLKPDARPTPDPKTGIPVTHWKQRIDALVDRHSQAGDTILVPTPCLAELLTAVPDVAKAVQEIASSSSMEPASFDSRCAIELGLETQKAINAGDKKAGSSEGWQKVKFDRQIAVIAKVFGAEIFYSDDENQSNFAIQLGMRVKHSWELDLPPKYAQISLIEDED